MCFIESKNAWCGTGKQSLHFQQKKTDINPHRPRCEVKLEVIHDTRTSIVLVSCIGCCLENKQDSAILLNCQNICLDKHSAGSVQEFTTHCSLIKELHASGQSEYVFKKAWHSYLDGHTDTQVHYMVGHCHATKHSLSVSVHVEVTRWSAQIFLFQCHPVQWLHLPALFAGSERLSTANSEPQSCSWHRDAEENRKRNTGKFGSLRGLDPTWVCFCLVSQNQKVQELVKKDI